MRYFSSKFSGHAVLALLVLMTGCASVSNYKKPNAMWEPIQKVGVYPFSSPHDDQMRREWSTQLFLTELRSMRRFEVVELPSPPPSPSGPRYQDAARKAGVDAYIEGTVGEMWETFVDLKLTDATTGEVLWSTRYHRGAGPEFSFRYKTSQQQLQRIFKIALRDLQNIS